MPIHLICQNWSSLSQWGDPAPHFSEGDESILVKLENKMCLK